MTSSTAGTAVDRARDVAAEGAWAAEADAEGPTPVVSKILLISVALAARAVVLIPNA